MATAAEHRAQYPIELVWEDPSQGVYARPSMYDEVLEQIQAKPGTWARIRVMSTTGAYGTRKRLAEQLKDDELWEVRVGLVENPDERAIFVRYRTAEQLSESAGAD